MYEEIKFDENGWLWTRSTPNGKWVKASAERTITMLWERYNQVFDSLQEAKRRLFVAGL